MLTDNQLTKAGQTSIDQKLINMSINLTVELPNLSSLNPPIKNLIITLLKYPIAFNQRA